MDEIKVLDWDDEIEDDGSSGSFVTLEEGDFDFEVTKFERAHSTPKPGAKTPACNQANITLKIEADGGNAYIVDKFPMASTMEWKMSAFFRSIGLKKHGEKIKMRWTEAIGLKGRAHITKDEGSKQGVFFNNIDYYIDPPAKTSKEDEEWS